METHTLERLNEVMALVEARLSAPLDLDTVAQAVHSSKYHLHRTFHRTVGMTLHAYIRRRRLTEAARLLVYTRDPLSQIALAAGYESQQAFSGVFKAMYKQTPLQFRTENRFYPLQLAVPLHETDPASFRISHATEEDIPMWMDFLPTVADGFPYLEESSHLQWLQKAIARRQALILRSGDTILAAAGYRSQGFLDFLGIHPQFRPKGAAEALLTQIAHELPGQPLSITTFRAGDKADLGQRAALQALGFRPAGLWTEYGYPTQRMVLSPERGGQHPC